MEHSATLTLTSAPSDLAADQGRVYRMEMAFRILLFVCAGIFSAFALGFIGYAVSSLTGSDRLICASCGAVFILPALLAIRLALMSATVLYSDRVERRGAFGSRSMRRVDIAGYQIIPGRNEPPYVKLYPKAKGARRLNVYRFQPDATFDDWFRDIPKVA